jgi:hypothetical protein
MMATTSTSLPDRDLEKIQRSLYVRLSVQNCSVVCVVVNWVNTGNVFNLDRQMFASRSVRVHYARGKVLRQSYSVCPAKVLLGAWFFTHFVCFPVVVWYSIQELLPPVLIQM